MTPVLMRVRVPFVLVLAVVLHASRYANSNHVDDASARATKRVTPQQFGHALRAKWYFTDNFTDMNHGFGGMTPRAVHEAQQRASTSCPAITRRSSDTSSSSNDRFVIGGAGYVVRRESNPAQWGWGCPAGSDVQAARAKVADFIGAASVDELVLVENAMGGINALMRSWPDLGGQRQSQAPQIQTRNKAIAGVDGVDMILLLSIGYDGFYNVYSWLQETLGLELLVVPLAFPLNGKDDVLRPVREALRVNGSRVSVAVFSHIASMPVVINPVEELVALCHNHTTGRIPVIIDGAHVPGQIPLNVSNIGADAYIGDLVGYIFRLRSFGWL